MKLSDKAYKEIPRIISSETIYSAKEIYNNFELLNYNFNKLLKCIDIAMKTNMDLMIICHVACMGPLKTSGIKIEIPPRPFFEIAFKKNKNIVKILKARNMNYKKNK